ncbi:uncharacterized protein Z520_09678 [Fonsecaea multimorphosa CBS 102226]|uniref:Major facilitator superfamily (MFS) profile domain-containing protein n=1 Tax=Fonsecaea multimorphosa CBS 102226 TaxID=1442371 RepID=A0A0D2JMT0_9EURO|nr:uncharacterized protein Z520_09678 [Fonsecaea multimorphosa CBS 102226]KIX94632.1 hypothetical protein Z520_09678 [Fonsecaea multimorphosa CBS 102226]OAL20338.1 hypothetical protein AYO22_09050 [Fonsecaea multimorphosa]
MSSPEKISPTEDLVETAEPGTSLMVPTKSTDLDEAIHYFTPDEQKKIVRRVDLRLILPLGLMYCVALIDRVNLGTAAVAGMAVDLKLTGERYPLIALVFLITYALFQPPATVATRRIGPRIFLPAITFLWGLTMICAALVEFWYQPIPIRLILGGLETGSFPGAAYLLSCWYPRYELQKRYSWFYGIGVFAQAFAGILGYGFSQIKNHGSRPAVYWGQHYGPTAEDPTAPSGILPGIAGWRWIFIIEDTMTALVAILIFPFLIDFPEVCRKGFAFTFLNERGIRFIVARVQKDRYDVLPEKFQLNKYLQAGLDIQVWAFSALFMLNSVPVYAIANFLPIILNSGMGFDVAVSQCLSSPPYLASGCLLLIFAWLGDRYHLRSPWILIGLALMLTGLPLLAFSTNTGARYFGVFLSTMGANANIPALLTWQANNIRGQWKRAFCSATLLGGGGIGGIIGTVVFRSQDAPKYTPGIITCLVATGMMVIITLALDMKVYFANKRARGGGEMIEGLEGFYHTY